MNSLDTWISDNIPDVVMDDASAWLARLDSEQCNAADTLAFARWLAEDPTHRSAFEELSEVWARLRTLADVGEQIDGSKVVRFPVEKATAPAAAVQPENSTGSDWSALVASVIVIFGVILHLAFAAPVETWSTQAAEKISLTLKDGSAVELNARTRIEVRFDDRQRSIRLVKGEALFDVAKGGPPFVVETPLGSVVALGTRFAVDASNGRVEVAVLEGKVSVSAGQAGPPLTEFDDNVVLLPASRNTLLNAGEGVALSADSVRQQTFGVGDIQQQLSWLSGSVHFDEQPLGRVLEEMRRYTDLNIYLRQHELAGVRISGRFSTRDIDDFLGQLSEKYNIIADAGDHGWVVLSGRGIR